MTEKDKPTVLLEYYLKKLRLPTMLREYASIAAVCQKDQSDFSTYLLRLVERELLDRENRGAERRVKDASFPVLKTIDTFDFKAQPSINKQLVRELMRGEYIDKKENVLLIGNPGTGKTHLACALAFSACAQGKKARFYTATGLITELVECREERRLQRLQKQLQRFHLLVLDELGYVPFSKAGAELLFEIISRAYEHHSLMLTSNLPFEEWTEVFGSERLAGALLDRLTHRCHILEANGESYRLRQAKKRSKHRPGQNITQTKNNPKNKRKEELDN
jgi:DNA replication protein DnaC